MAAVVRPAATPLGLEIGDTVATTMGNGKVAGFSGGSVVVQYSFGRGFMSSLSVAKASSQPEPGHELVELISKRGNKRRAYASIGSVQATSAQLGMQASSVPSAGLMGGTAAAAGHGGIAAQAHTGTVSVDGARTSHGSYKRGREGVDF